MSHHLRHGKKRPPDGFELLEDELDRFEMEMREAVADPHDGKRVVEAMWPIHKIHYQKNRYIFDLYYKKKVITKQVYDYCIKQKIVDANLVAKWKKPGYEQLCSLTAIQTRDTQHGTVSLCRVPLHRRAASGGDRVRPTQTTGCISCCSGDGGPIWWDSLESEPDSSAKRSAVPTDEERELADRAKRLREN